MLIVLAATIALAATWMLALKPKPVAVENTPLAPTQAIDKARQASAASDAGNAARQAAARSAGDASAGTGPASSAAASATKSAPVKSAAAKPKAAKRRAATAAKSPAARSAGRPSAAVMRDIRAHKVVVILFWSAKSADDIATVGELGSLDRHNGRVAVHVVRIGSAARYASIARGLPINTSPTTLVIDRQRRPRAINGLAEPRELRRAVRAALARQ